MAKETLFGQHHESRTLGTGQTNADFLIACLAGGISRASAFVLAAKP